MEQADNTLVGALKSPKSTASPKELILMYSIVFVNPVVSGVGVRPPPKTPLVGLEQDDEYCLPTLKSPKSTASPKELILMYSITFKYVAAGVGVNPPAKTPLVELEQALKLDLPTLKSPKSTASPVELIVMYSIVFKYVAAGVDVNPPAKTPLVELEQALKPFLPTLKSPKSTASPVELIVMYSIVLKYVNAGVGVNPPAKIPLVELEQTPKLYLPTLKSPKSIASPVELIVMYSIVFVVNPPPKTPLVELEREATNLLVALKSPKSTAFPAELILIYCITSVSAFAGDGPVNPPPKTPRAPAVVSEPTPRLGVSVTISHHWS